MLAGSQVSNTGTTTIIGTAAHHGDVGVSPGNSITGGTLCPAANCFNFIGAGIGTIHAGDAAAAAAQADLTAAYLNLAGRPTTVNLTGQNLGGLTLIPGVYNFNSSAQLTGAVTLNGLGNPNSVFIFNIGSTLTTASASSVLLINGAQGGNVFWRVGSSATLGTATSFAGDILAQASITLNTGATINCGAAWASTGAVSLDTNTISMCSVIVGPGGPGGIPQLVLLLPPSASANERAVATAIDNFVSNGGTLPLAFMNLFNLSSADLANALSQISGEAGTGIAQAGTQAMNSFLSLVTNPYDNNRPFAENRPTAPMIFKAKPLNAALADPHRWGVWAAVYGGQTNAAGDPFGIGSHARTVSAVGYATGLDYRVTPYTVVGFALAGGNTRYGLSDGLGAGHSDMFQAAIYSSTRIHAAYVSTAIAYAWHRVSTDRYVTVAGVDHLTADFSAHNIGARIEGGYRFAIPGVFGFPTWSGITPYAAAQVQSFRTPSYSETAVSGSPIFALAYEARTTTTARTELGAWVDWSTLVEYGPVLTLRARAAWAHDYWSAPNITASFVALPGSTFIVTGATPARDLLLASAGLELGFRNGFSLATRFDGEFASHSQKYAGTARLRYIW